MSIYLACLFVAAGTTMVALVLSGERIANLEMVLLLAGAAAIAERGTVRLTRSLEISVALLPTLFAAVVFGPLAAMLVSAASMLADLRPEKTVPSPVLKWAIYTASRSITGAAAGVVAVATLGLFESRASAIVAATAAGAFTATALDVSFVTLTLGLRGKGRLLDGPRVLGPVVLSSVPLYTPVVALLAFAYTEVSPWTIVLFVVPALAAQRLFALYQDQRRLTDDLVAVNEQLERANLSFASALVATLDARDRYTAGHSAAVATYARDIAARMGLSVEEQQLAYLCGLVHDIGKVGLPAGLLEKQGPLTLEERRRMQEHSVIGERILAKVDDYAEISKIVRHHHERVDGEGYPDRLVDERIPLISRIITVADAYDAMTSDRPYREAMPSRVARLRLAQAVESQFDTAVVAAFEAILASASEDYRSGRALVNLEERRALQAPLVAASV